jgi:hypothetical protein
VELERVDAFEAKLCRADVGQPVRRPDPLETSALRARRSLGQVLNDSGSERAASSAKTDLSASDTLALRTYGEQWNHAHIGRRQQPMKGTT